MTAFASHFAFEFKSSLRNRMMLFLDYLFPLGVYLIISALMTQINQGFRDNLIAVMVCFVGMSVPLLSIPEPMVKARDSGIYRSYRIHGVPERSILALPVAATFVHVGIVAFIVVLTAPLLFGAPLPSDGFALLLGFVLLTLACCALSVLIGVVAFDGRASNILAQAIFLPSMMIGGLMISTELLPEGMRTLGMLLPTSQAMNIMTGSIPGLPSWVSALVLASTTILGFMCAKLLFTWDRRNRARVNPAVALIVLLPSVLGLLVSVVLN